MVASNGKKARPSIKPLLASATEKPILVNLHSILYHHQDKNPLALQPQGLIKDVLASILGSSKVDILLWFTDCTKCKDKDIFKDQNLVSSFKKALKMFMKRHLSNHPSIYLSIQHLQFIQERFEAAVGQLGYTGYTIPKAFLRQKAHIIPISQIYII